MNNGITKQKKLFLMALALGAAFLPQAVFADSSWIWISEKRPYDLLPVVVVLTLLIEIAAINYIPRVQDLKRTTLVVVAANLLSFLIPFLGVALGGQVHPYPSSLDDYHYIVGLGYLILTICAELPVVYLFFHEKVQNRKLLFWTVIGANVATTLMVFAIEKFFCQGYYA